MRNESAVLSNSASLAVVSLSVSIISACAATVPKELLSARAAYQLTSHGPAMEVVPAEVHKAKVALERAELAFNDQPKAQSTRDLAYVAERAAQLAGVLALQAQDVKDRVALDGMSQTQLAQNHTRTKTELAGAKAQIAEGDLQRVSDGDKLNAERLARQNAEAKSAETEAKNKTLQASLTKLAAFKEEERGMVLTLSGSVLFVSGNDKLLPAAQTRLDQIAAALSSSGDRSLLVEGYTDSRGRDAYNVDLSQRRADAVRSYIVGRGFPAEKIKAAGLGKSKPIASNNDADGRANNRRVEIVILP